MLKIRCKDCNVELTAHPTQTRCCGCANMMTVCNDKVTALDLARIVMVESSQGNQKSKVFSDEDLAFQEARRQRKVRKLDFEIR
jgi:hypothetical protein